MKAGNIRGERAVRRVSYLELDRAARTHENAKRALAEYHELLGRKTRPVAFFSRKSGYVVEASGPQARQETRDNPSAR